MGVGDNAAEVCGSVVTDAGTKNDSLCILLLEELEHLTQREGAADIGIKDEETLRATLENGISEVVETSSGAEGLVFAEVLDAELGELYTG